MFRVSGVPGRRGGCFHLRQCKARVVEKGASGRCQLDTADAAREQLHADLIFQVPHLAAERRLCRVQAPLGGKGQAAFLCDGDEIAEMAQLHGLIPCLRGMEPNL